MEICNDEKIELKRKELSNYFNSYSKDIHQHYFNMKSKVTKWSYSLGVTEELIPFENLIPSVISIKKGKPLAKPSKSNFESENLVTYGIDNNENILLVIRKYDKDVTKYGENIRYVDYINEEKVIVNAHIYESNPASSRLSSLCHVYEENGLVYYVSITPPNNWYVRVDELQDNRIKKISMFATSWYKQMDYSIYYDNSSVLSKIMIGEHLHWENRL
ncbi:hypothetical protein [Lysinibacillus sp. NPDC096212]|uniref:hypothetical protein n=1 Tax=Lysinibacillus sp. NPDC096212 TaxID=3364135 RepID=UPI0037FD22EB